MKTTTYTVRYAYPDERFQYTHEHAVNLEAAKASADAWKSAGGWGRDPELLHVWVEDARRDVVYGVRLPETAPKRN